MYGMYYIIFRSCVHYLSREKKEYRQHNNRTCTQRWSIDIFCLLRRWAPDVWASERERMSVYSTMIDNQHTNTWRRRHTELKQKHTIHSKLSHTSSTSKCCPSNVESNAYFDFLVSSSSPSILLVVLFCKPMHRKTEWSAVRGAHRIANVCVGRCMCWNAETQAEHRSVQCAVFRCLRFASHSDHKHSCVCVRLSRCEWMSEHVCVCVYTEPVLLRKCLL